MFIAHLPAGYLLTRCLQRKAGNHSQRVLWAGLIASILPDVDLFYYYLVDHRQTLHHHYITHLPMAWLFAALVVSACITIAGRQRYLIYVGVCLANVMLHMLLDSIAAGIYWLYPLSGVEVNLIQVPATHRWWVWNFVLHWTFGLELLIIIAAFWTWKQHAKNHTYRRR